MDDALRARFNHTLGDEELADNFVNMNAIETLDAS
jgi:hypothetical protein